MQDLSVCNVSAQSEEVAAKRKVNSLALGAAMRRAPVQRIVGIDMGKKDQVCVFARDRVVQRATVTEREPLEDQYGRLLGPGTDRALVIMEASRDAWYLYDLFYEWGHEVWIVDTTRARQLGIGQHKRKNDRIDAETLARAGYENRVPRAWVLSRSSQSLRAALQNRRLLVTTRASLVVSIRGQLRAQGVRVPSCSTQDFVKKLDTTKMAPFLRQQIEPLAAVLRPLNPQIDEIDKQLDKLLADLPVVELLASVPGVGRIVAAAFISVIDVPGRFRNAHQVGSYLGLVPSEFTSGKRKLGAITKMGNAYLRAMLVQAAWALMKTRGSDPLKYWASRLAKKRGKRVAVVALARRLGGIMWAMWKTNKAYDPELLSNRSARGKRKELDEAKASVAHLSSCAAKAGTKKRRESAKTRASAAGLEASDTTAASKTKTRRERSA